MAAKKIKFSLQSQFIASVYTNYRNFMQCRLTPKILQINSHAAVAAAAAFSQKF